MIADTGWDTPPFLLPTACLQRKRPLPRGTSCKRSLAEHSCPPTQPQPQTCKSKRFTLHGCHDSSFRCFRVTALSVIVVLAVGNFLAKAASDSDFTTTKDNKARCADGFGGAFLRSSFSLRGKASLKKVNLMSFQNICGMENSMQPMLAFFRLCLRRVRPVFKSNLSKGSVFLIQRLLVNACGRIQTWP